jgi:thiosulfate/3-mercaptopyruvate sulfurtransferase
VPVGGYAHPESLIQAEELKALLDRKAPKVRVIDVRHNAKYYLGHIPGAQQLWRPHLEGKNPGLPGHLLSRTQVEALLGRLGVGPEDTLILYADQYDHARFWFILAYYGFPLERLRFLDGGLAAWQSKGYPTQITAPRISRTSVRLPEKSPFPALVAHMHEVKGAVKDPRKALVDCRSRREYLGEEFKEGAARPGHIPGAVGLDWREDLVAAGPFKGYWQGAAEIRKLYAARGVTPDKDVYLYAHHGPPAAHSLAALYLAGFPLEKLHLFEGSWMEWSRSQEAAELGDPLTPRPPPGKPEKAGKRGSRDKKGAL